MRPLVLLSPLAPGGSEEAAASVLIRLRSAGVDVPVGTATPSTGSRLASELGKHGIDPTDLGGDLLADPRAVVRLVRLLHTERIDLVHAHGHTASILAAAAARLRRTRVVITRYVPDEPAESLRQKAKARLALSAFQGADVPVAASHATAEHLARITRLPANRIRVVHNGVDVEAYARPAAETARRALCYDLDVAPTDRLVLFPASLEPGKGHDVLVDALPDLQSRNPGLRVLLAGSGELEGWLRRRTSGATDVVRFLGHRADMPELMAACDLVILPSRREALPTILMEAAAAGRGVVSTRVGAVAEIVEHGRTGLLIPPANPRHLSAAVTALLDAPQRNRAFGERARRLAWTRFSIDRQAERTVSLWREAFSDASGGAGGRWRHRPPGAGTGRAAGGPELSGAPVSPRGRP